jgi:hypothetical protein
MENSGEAGILALASWFDWRKGLVEKSSCCYSHAEADWWEWTSGHLEKPAEMTQSEAVLLYLGFPTPEIL